MKKFISVLLTLALLCGMLTLSASAVTENTHTLRFRSDGSFKILQVTDIQDTPCVAPAIIDYLQTICESEKPDLVVLTGDNIGKNTGKASTQHIAEFQVRFAIRSFMSMFQKLNIPVAVVFGNHDSENRVSKEYQMGVYTSYPNCVAIDEGDDLYGCGTYNVPILASGSEKTAYNLWFFDSNMYDETNGGYDYVHQDQVNWYVQKSQQLKAQNGGVPVPSMVFQHIIVNEIKDAISANELVSGSLNETPNPSNTRSTEFSAMVKQGDVKAMFFGHDHENTFVFRHQGIDLVATPAAGFTLSSDNRGVRVIELNEKNTSTYTTHVINYRETFCTDALSTARYQMNAAENGTKVQLENAAKYVFLSVLKGKFSYKTVYELISLFM